MPMVYPGPTTLPFCLLGMLIPTSSYQLHLLIRYHRLYFFVYLMMSLLFSHLNDHRAAASTNFCYVSHTKKISNTYKRQPSGNSSKKSSQLRDHSGNQAFKTMATSTGQPSQDQARGHGYKGVTAFGISSSEIAVGQRNSFDSARISQWAAHSATGPSTFTDYGVQDQGSFSYSNDLAQAGISSQVPSGFSVSSPNAFSIAVHATPVHLQYGPGFTYSETSTADAGDALPRTCVDQEISQDQGLNYAPFFDDDACSTGLSSNMNSHAYAAFAAGDFLPLDPVEAHPPTLVGNNSNNNGLTISSAWDVPRADMTQTIDWSPVSEITPSTSSMQSSKSFLGHQQDTPVSGSMYDGIFMTGQNAQMDGDNAMNPSFSLGETMVDLSSMSYLDPERLAFTSTTCHYLNLIRFLVPSGLNKTSSGLLFLLWICGLDMISPARLMEPLPRTLVMKDPDVLVRASPRFLETMSSTRQHQRMAYILVHLPQRIIARTSQKS